MDHLELSDTTSDEPMTPGLYANVALGRSWEIEAPVWHHNTSNLSKRICIPFSQSAIETRWLDGGSWWTPWEQVSSCLFCDLGSGSQAFSTSRTRRWTFTGGVGMSFGAVKGLAREPAQEIVTYRQTTTCDCKGNDRRTCVWMQNRMLWMKVQQRSRHSQGGCGVPVETTYGAWIEGHADLPTNDEVINKNFTCSTGNGCDC